MVGASHGALWGLTSRLHRSDDPRRMTSEPPEIEAVEEALHDASLDPRRWTHALGLAARFVTGGDAGALAALTFIESASATTGWMLHGGDEHERVVAFGDGGRHPLFLGSRALPEGYVGPSEAFAAPGDLARTTLARRWLTDEGTVRGMSALVTSTPAVAASLHVLARGELAAWRASADDRLRALLAPTRRALAVYLRLRRAREHAAIDRALLDLVDVAAFVVDADGAVSHCNLAANSLLERGDVLTLRDGFVRCVRGAADQHFQAAIAQAAQDLEPTARVVTLARTSGRRPLLMFVSSTRTSERHQRGEVAVLVRDTGAQGPHTEDVLKQLFGLTSTEAKLSLAIADGQTPSEVADALGRSVETVRTHLKRVFEKTSTTRQAELVRLVLSEVPPVRVDPEPGATAPSRAPPRRR